MDAVGSAPSTVLVCGAGFGGIAAAVALRRQFSPDALSILLVDRRRDFVMGLRKTWAALGIDTLEAGRRELAAIAGVQVVTGEVNAIKVERRAVQVDGRELRGDAVILALGAEHAMEAVPGLAQHGINIWDRTAAERARVALMGMTGGRLVIGIFGMPYSCPPAPFELAMLARERLNKAVEISIFTPAPIALPVVGALESSKLEALVSQRGIEFRPGRRAVAVTDGSVHFADGSELPFDVLLAVPPHRCPQVLVGAGLAEEGGWVKPDPRTLETAHEGVYAVGDCTSIMLANGLPLPKAGIFAQAQGEVVAARIAARLGGLPPSAIFTGEGTCFIETGGGQAAAAQGAFMADPAKVQISEPSPATMSEKLAFERSRLEAWFGR